MNYIEMVRINGFKKFFEIDVPLNKEMNIFVGENESGKTTIFEAIKIVLNQQYRNTDKSILKELFNVQMIENFESNPSVKTLPMITIELRLHLDPKSKNAEYFYGENNSDKEAQYGIVFECKFDEDIGSELEKNIENGKIPYEYYMLRWTTFAGLQYYFMKRPFTFLSIDTTHGETNSSFNYYYRTLFFNQYDETIRMNAKDKFREKLNSAFQDINLEPLDENRNFGINDKKVILETVLSVYENSIPLENRGSGMESLIIPNNN